MYRSLIAAGLIITLAVLVGVYEKSKYATTIVNSPGEMVSKNGRYKYNPIRKDTLNYIKTLNSGRIYRAKDKHPRVVFYTNVVDTTCPYRRNFQNVMKKYAKSESWNQGYTFINIDTHMVEELYFVNNQDKREYFSFNKDCDYFCIVDLKKNLIYHGISNSDGYVNAVLYAFFEK